MILVSKQVRWWIDIERICGSIEGRRWFDEELEWEEDCVLAG